MMKMDLLQGALDLGGSLPMRYLPIFSVFLWEPAKELICVAGEAYEDTIWSMARTLSACRLGMR